MLHRTARRAGPWAALLWIPAAVVAGSAPPANGQGVLSVSTEFSGGEYAGASVAGVGDIDDDGHDDIAIGCPGRPADAASGRVVVQSGADGSLLFERLGGIGDRLGTSVAGVGDVNGDGYEDIAIGANQTDGGIDEGDPSGYVVVVSGKDGATLLDIQGTSSSEAFGQSVRPAGDANLDGIPDFVVGAPSIKADDSGTGRAVVFSGYTGTIIREFHGKAHGDWSFGHAVDGGADFNGDGSTDIVVGAYWNYWVNSPVGEAYLCSALDGVTIHTLKTGIGIGRFGWSVAALGDTDDDGCDDVLIGSRTEYSTWDSYGYAGSARVYSGLSGSLRYTLLGAPTTGSFGSSVTGLPDLDQDGAVDFAVGASALSTTYPNPDPSDRGYVRVFSGRDGSPLYTKRHHQSGSGFGEAIAHAGDTNNDGKPDLIVGAPGRDGIEPDQGYAAVIDAGTEFVVGTRLTGELIDGRTDSAVFHGIKKEEVTLKVLDLAGDLELEVAFFNDLGEKFEYFSLDKVGEKKSVILDRHGRWRLDIRAAEGTAGTYRLKTVRELPDTASKNKWFKKVQSNGHLPVTFVALTGTQVNVKINTTAGTQSPYLSGYVVHSQGLTVLEDISDYVTITDSTYRVDGYPAPRDGKYFLKFWGITPSKVKAKFTRTPPKPDVDELILP